MKTYKKILAVSAAAMAAATLPATAASAEILVFKASDYTGGSHGLWTNTLDSGADRFYSFQSDVLFTVDTDAGTATFAGTAINGSGDVATLDLSLGGFLETTNGTAFTYKQEGGGVYDPIADSPDVDFFSTLSGTITIDGTSFDVDIPPFQGSHIFQYGLGANAKNAGEFGGSSWLRLDGVKNHLDINFNLTPVPEPATWAMMIVGFGAVGASLRRRKSRVKVSYA